LETPIHHNQYSIIVMPSSRRLKVTGFIVVLTFLIIFYVTNGAKNTYNSPFYTRTVDAIKSRQDADARQDMMAEEKQRLGRVERLQKEHDAAISAAAPAKETGMLSGDVAQAVGVAHGADKQKPVMEDVKQGVSAAAEAAHQAQTAVADKVKGVAGRVTMKKDDRVVDAKSTAKGDDGVAKVGNVEPKASQALTSAAETEEEHAVETELNDILKKGPIIIFSKSYCPFSQKAKHILLDLYAITPAPYVVELDRHELGPGLQAALHKSTGRRTVPNVLISGKSIGGSDDIAALHRDGKLVDTVTAMGGKRIMSVVPKDAADGNAKAGLKFKA